MTQTTQEIYASNEHNECKEVRNKKTYCVVCVSCAACVCCAGLLACVLFLRRLRQLRQESTQGLSVVCVELDGKQALVTKCVCRCYRTAKCCRVFLTARDVNGHLHRSVRRQLRRLHQATTVQQCLPVRITADIYQRPRLRFYAGNPSPLTSGKQSFPPSRTNPFPSFPFDPYIFPFSFFFPSLLSRLFPG